LPGKLIKDPDTLDLVSDRGQVLGKRIIFLKFSCIEDAGQDFRVALIVVYVFSIKGVNLW
jgi:hypothetical protein